MTPLLTSLFLNIAFFLVVSPACIGIIRKAKAALQGRVGASIFQPYSDLLKLFRKDECLSSDASAVFRIAPFIIFGATLTALSGIPLLSVGQSVSTGNLFLFVYLLALATFFIALAGMDTGSSFGGFGSSREMSLSALAEAALVFSFIPLALSAHSSNLSDIAEGVLSLPAIDLLPVFIAFMAFFIALLAENARVPVDNPATHLELTMIHEAMILEYSGKRLALVEWASYAKLLGFIVLGANLFFPWGLSFGAFTSVTGTLAASLFLAAKVLVFALVIALLESTIAKLRIFRVPGLLSTAFVLGAVAIALTIV